ncbi:CLUMA_CG006255, isoform A [Clunio marinus]|uniref:CLUMA_CG006255, isoform A n=1 Tax=Clunio marinus TaxID=568069 RepID=A0A1J1HXM3_9DIPT|nr:CLUMA_CG006255, isoform A [Clunio marinus]
MKIGGFINDCSYSSEKFARSGFEAIETVVLPEGPLPDFSHAIEPHLRRPGMPTKLDRGIVTLMNDYTICEKGQTLTPEQAKILKLVERPLATFKVNIECYYTKKDGFEAIKMPESDKKSFLRKPMKAKDKLNLKNNKTSKKSDCKSKEAIMMEIIEASDSNGEDYDDTGSDKDMEASD